MMRCTLVFLTLLVRLGQSGLAKCGLWLAFKVSSKCRGLIRDGVKDERLCACFDQNFGEDKAMQNNCILPGASGRSLWEMYLECTSEPDATPTALPTSKPNALPTSAPTALPTPTPTESKLTSNPTSRPTSKPTSKPTSHPTPEPTSQSDSTSHPTPEPTSQSGSGDEGTAPSATPSPTEAIDGGSKTPPGTEDDEICDPKLCATSEFDPICKKGIQYNNRCQAKCSGIEAGVDGAVQGSCLDDGVRCKLGTTCKRCKKEASLWPSKNYVACGQDSCLRRGARCTTSSVFAWGWRMDRCRECCNGHEWKWLKWAHICK